VAEFVRAASLAELPPGTLLGVEVEDRAVCLANADGTIYAFRDNCSHREYPLHDGALDGTRLECAWHGGKFDLGSGGRAVGLPAIKPIEMYEVRIEGDDVLVAL
jgi:3-phenylpropionate/trans-cinnamate dioxygenase ferredoxin subunit